MAQFLLIFLCLGVGWWLKKSKLVAADGFKTLNAVVLNFALPALTLLHIPAIKIESQLLLAVLTPWLNLLLAWLVFGVIGRARNWGKPLTGAVIMMVGFGNTSFVGIPVIEAFYGKESLKTVLMLDQPGSFVALTTLGIVIVNLYADKNNIRLKDIVWNMVKFPPMVAFVVALVLNIVDFKWSPSAHDLLGLLANMVVPLALISVGMQWQLQLSHLNDKVLWLGLGFKLLLFPLLIFVILALVLHQSGEVIEIIILEAAMAPMITAGILASAYNLKPQYCNTMLGVGIPLSFVTLALWYGFLKWFF